MINNLLKLGKLRMRSLYATGMQKIDQCDSKSVENISAKEIKTSNPKSFQQIGLLPRASKDCMINISIFHRMELKEYLCREKEKLDGKLKHKAGVQ